MFLLFFCCPECKQEEETTIRVEYMKNDSTEYTPRYATLGGMLNGCACGVWAEMQDDFKKIFAVKLKVTL